MAEWDNAVAVAAKWWADHLRANERPSRDAGGVYPHTTPEQAAAVGLMLGIDPDSAVDALVFGGAKVPNFTAEQVDLFERKLRRVLHWAMFFALVGNRDTRLFVGVDYDPNEHLTIAGIYSGLITRDNDNLSPYLPIKTRMWITPKQVKVREGYGGESIILYAT